MYLKMLNISDIKPYFRNPRINDGAIDPVIKKKKKNGYRARIIVDNNGVIIAGHTRWKAIKKLGWEKVEVWVADDMTEEQINDYRIRDNLTSDFASWDFDALQEEITENGLDFDLGDFGIGTLADEINNEQNKYSKETKIPQYVPNDNVPSIDQLINTDKLDDLLNGIDDSGVSEAEKKFLRIAAMRHAVIKFDEVADYYAAASKEMQELMEKQALVIIDYQDAIANGYAVLSSELESILGD